MADERQLRFLIAAGGTVGHVAPALAVAEALRRRGGLVTFAGHLGLSVCAEGVEDVADLDHLVSLGVSHVQGYLLARPAPGWQEVQAGPVPAAS